MKKPIATWIWSTAEAFAKQDEYLQFAEDNHVRKVYLQIDPTINEEYYVQFIKQANARQIAVYALGGSPEWVMDLADFEAFSLWVTQFQQQYALFAGIHADIEPYILESWHTNRQALIEPFFERIESLRKLTNALSFQLEIDSPFWFDEVFYNNKFGQGTVSEWLIDNTDHVTIMAYRNTAHGENGVNTLVENELHYATQKQKTITIALETAASNEGEEVSFYGHTEQQLRAEIHKIEQAWAENTALTSIGIHSMHSWMVLKNSAGK